MIGPAVVLAVLVGIFCTGLYALVRGSVGGRFPLVVLLAILGAWAGDSLDGRLGFDPVRIGDFHVLGAVIGAALGIALVSVIAALGPVGDRT